MAAGDSLIEPDTAADALDLRAPPAVVPARAGIAPPAELPPAFPVETPEQRQEAATRALGILQHEAASDPVLAADPSHQREIARVTAMAGNPAAAPSSAPIVQPEPTAAPGAQQPQQQAQAAPAGPPTWDEVLRLPQMRHLSHDELEAARHQYFVDVVAPLVPTPDLPAARAAFDSDTAPGPINRAVRAIGDAARELRTNSIVDWVKSGINAVDKGLTEPRGPKPEDVPFDRPYSERLKGYMAQGRTIDEADAAIRRDMSKGEDYSQPLRTRSGGDTVFGRELGRGFKGLASTLDGIRLSETAGVIEAYRAQAVKEGKKPEEVAIPAGRVGGYQEAVTNYQRLRADMDHRKRELELLPQSSAVRKMFDGEGAEGVDNFVNAFKEDPKGASAVLIGGSVPGSMAMLAAAVLARFGGATPTLAAGAAGLTSATTEFGNDYADNRAKGMAHNEAWNRAAIKAGVIGAFDAASFKSAGHALDQITKANAVKEWFKESSRQAVLGAGGETLGSVASGEMPQPGQVMAEAAGEFMMGAPEGVATMGGPKQAAAAAAAAAAKPAEVPAEDVLGRVEPTLAPEKPRAAGAVAQDTGAGDLYTPAEPVAAAAAKEEAKPPAFVDGKDTSFATERGAKIDGRYAVADVGELVTSHDTTLNVNKDYPADLQPRDRSRDASEVQIAKIAQNLQPDFLGASPQASQGAPIVGDDGIVESGNARTIALQRAYDADQAKGYRDWLLKNAESFGLDPAKLSQVKRPVLVRVRTTPVNRAEFARQANESSVAQLSPLESARADAARLKSIDDLKTGENGEIHGSENMPFIRRFVGMLPVTEQSALVTGTGELSQAGMTRVRNAILAKAYGGGDTVMRMVESPDDNIRNISNALVRVAPRVAKAREAMAEGALHNLDITEDFLKAVEWTSKLRADKKDVGQWLAQISFFEADASQEFKALMRFLDENSRSPKKIAEFIELYLTSVEAAGSPSQGAMFGDQVPDKGAIIESAKKGVSGEPVVREGEGKAAAAADGAAQGNRGEGSSGKPGSDGAQAAAGAKPEGERSAEGGARQAEGAVDQAAHEAATSQKNDKLEPTPAQKEAGNFEKGHAKIGGLEISIENPAGSRRRPQWPALKQHYGYIRGTVGRDKDHVDVFIKQGTPAAWDGTVFVVNQAKADGSFDEHKAMIGFADEKAARAAYLSNYPAGWDKRVMSIAPRELDAFKEWALDKTDAGPKGGALEPEARKATPALSRAEPKPFADAVRELVTGKGDPRETLTVSNTPPVLQMLGVKPHRLVLGGSTISKMLYDHGLPMPMVQRLPAMIADPVLVFESDTVPGDFVVVTTEKFQGMPVVVTIRPEGDINREVVNVVTSAYPRAKAGEAFGRWVKGDLLAYVDQQKRPEWQRSVGLQLPGKMPSRSAGKSLLTQADLVKKLGGSGGSGKGPESPVFSRAPGGASPVYDMSEDGPRLVAGDVGIVQPSKWETRHGMTMYEHTIIANQKPIGIVTLGWIGDKIAFLPNIRLDLSARGKGTGEAVVRAIVEHNGTGHELTVGYIAHTAREFWRKMGVRIEDTDEGTFGQVSVDSYRDARPVDAGGAAQQGGGEKGPDAQAGRAREVGKNEGSLRRSEVGAGAADVGRVSAEVAAITKAWAKSPAIEVVPTPSDLPFAAPADAQGAFWKGKVYIVASHNVDAARTQFTVFHEALGHYGLNRFFGNELTGVLREISIKNANVRAAAEKWKAANPKPKGWTDDEYRTHAIEEALSDLAGSGRKITGLGKLLAKVQAWLRANGFAAVADWLEKASDAEALAVLAKAREMVEGEAKAEPRVAGELSPRFSKPAAPFYSELARAVAQAKAQVAPPDQWLSIIKGLPGVKADEIEWSGVNDWLQAVKDQDPKRRVTRDDVGEFLRENGVRVEERMIGGPGSMAEKDRLRVELDAKGYDLLTDDIEGEILTLNRRSDGATFYGANYSDDDQEPFSSLPADVQGLAILFDTAAREQAQEITADDGTRYGEYTLPGGTNYRELLLTFPTKPSEAQKRLKAAEAAVIDQAKKEHFGVAGARDYALQAARDDLADGQKKIMSAAMRPLVKNLRTAYVESSWSEGGGEIFQSVHFDEPNLLAHTRLTDRVDADGKKVLFVEEFQSDWAQKAKRKGFRKLSIQEYTDRIGQANRKGDSAEAKRLADEMGSDQGVEPGPFVGKTESWVNLLLKRVISYAADHGYDRVAWTTGAQQVERYDLSKHVHTLAYQKNADGSFDLKAYTERHLEGHDIGTKVPAHKLPDHVEKSVADKIIAGAGAASKLEPWRNLTGVDLKVGGEGMVAFYDQIVPQLASALLKKFGGGKVASVEIPRELTIFPDSPENGGGWVVAEAGKGGLVLEADLKTKEAAERWVADNKASDMVQPGFDITPALRERGRAGMPMFSRAPASAAPRRRETLFNAAVRIPTQLLRVDKATSWAYDNLIIKLGGMLTPETVKAGMGHDYGIPEAVSDRRSQMWGNQRRQLRDVAGVLGKLLNLTRAESRVAYEWMNDRAGDELLAQLPEESRTVLQGVKEKIDTLSREAVRLGQLSADTYERSRMAYLHRSYRKHELDATKQDKVARARAVKILGNQYKGRGMVDAVDMSKLKSTAPEWWGRKLQERKGDKGLKGQNFVRLERRENRGDGAAELPGVEPSTQRGRLREVAYWPAGEAVPARYEGWSRDAGEWQVRDVKGPKVVLWRDFTKAERQRMGEIDEVRFAVAKTLHQMIHDVEAGKYLEYLANHHARAEEKLPRGAQIAEAKESLFRTFGKDEWVKVAQGTVPGTKVEKYGKLAGLYVPGPIWNDVRQVVNVRYAPLGEAYATALKAWKISKTALSPAVHMNNVMANMVMADWHDVLARDLYKALRVMIQSEKPENKVLIQTFEDNGGSEGMFVLSELQKEQLQPLIDELQKEVNRADASGMINASSVLQAMLSGKFREAFEAAKGGKAARGAKVAAGAMIDLYQAEDTVFRLAAFLKAKADGKSDAEAGKFARKSFLDYSINAPWVQMMRSTALPFISFIYRAAPMMLEAYARKPWKLAKLWVVLGGLNALGYMLSGGDEDKERKLLPKEKQGRILGFLPPKLIRMPWNDAQGNPVFLDVRRFIPVGDVFDLEQTHAALPWSPVAMPGGPLALALELAANRSQFTGKNITNESDTALEIMQKVSDHIFKAVAPNLPFVPGTYSFQAITGAGKGRTDQFGREQSLPQALGSSIGVKLAAYPADVAKLGIKAEFSQQKEEIEKEIRRLAREHARKGISTDDFKDKVQYQVNKLRRLSDETRERVR